MLIHLPYPFKYNNFRFVCGLLFRQRTTHTLWCHCDLCGIVLSCPLMWGRHFIQLLWYWLHEDLVDYCTTCMNCGSTAGWTQGRLFIFFSWFKFSLVCSHTHSFPKVLSSYIKTPWTSKTMIKSICFLFHSLDTGPLGKDKNDGVWKQFK